MANRQDKDKKEQEILKKWHNGWIRLGTIMINVLCVIMIVLGIYGVVTNRSKGGAGNSFFFGDDY